MSNTIDYTSSLRRLSSMNAVAARKACSRNSRSWRGRIVLFPLLLSMLSGCAGRPENVLQPVALTTNDTSRVDMLVATTRKPAADPGELYSGERGTAISLNNLTVSIPPDEARKVGEVQWPKRVPPNPEKEFAVLKDEKVSSEHQALNWFRKNRNAKRQVIIFVHGFNNTYADAVFRFAQITYKRRCKIRPR